jgi:hypothetical protein
LFSIIYPKKDDRLTIEHVVEHKKIYFALNSMNYPPIGLNLCRNSRFMSSLKQCTMKKIFLCFLCFLSTLFVLAQNADPLSVGKLNLASGDEAFRFVGGYDGRKIDLVGEVFLNDTLYHEGELKTSKRLYTNEMKYRFNQVERTVQVRLADGKEMYINEKDIVYCNIVIEGKTITLVPAKVPNGRKITIMQVIYKSPNMQLYRDARKFIFRVKSNDIDGYSTEKVYDEVRKDYRYYLRIGDSGEFTEVKTTVKSFAQALPEKRSQIELLFKNAKKKDGLTVTKLSNIMAQLDK